MRASTISLFVGNFLLGGFLGAGRNEFFSVGWGFITVCILVTILVAMGAYNQRKSQQIVVFGEFETMSKNRGSILRKTVVGLNILLIILIALTFLSFGGINPKNPFILPTVVITITSVLNMISLRDSTRLTITSPNANPLQRTGMIRTIALMMDFIMVTLCLLTIVNREFTAYVAAFVLIYGLSFYVLWRDRRDNKVRLTGSI